MKTLFDNTTIVGMNLNNRFFRSATYDGQADKQGHLTPELLQTYEKLAQGGVGTIITGMVCVTELDQPVPRPMALYSDIFINEYKKMTEAVHNYGANIVAQLSCGGAQTNFVIEGKVVWGPSAIEDMGYKTTPQEMSKDDISFVQKCFADAAFRAKKAGFDGVQIHAAHGYLLSKFLTPYYNRRSDEYGGSTANRARMIFETYQSIRDKVGLDYPVLIKINSGDYLDQGMVFEECKYICKQLEQMGIDAIEISGGTVSSRPNEGPSRKISTEQESYYKTYAAEIAADIGVPVILVGGNRDFESLTEILNQTKISYFAFSRPLIREYDLVNRWQSGDTSRATCISCRKCFGANGICVFNK